MITEATKIIPPIFRKYCSPLCHMCRVVLFNVGSLYGGSSITKGTSLLVNMKRLKRRATMTANNMPVPYKANKMVPGYCGKKAAINKIYTGSRALHDINGLMSMVSKRLFRYSIVLVAIIAGTLQPNPIINGMKDLPCRPILCITLSIMKAARAM